MYPALNDLRSIVCIAHGRAGDIRPYRIVKIIAMLRLGIICFLTLQTIYTNWGRRLAVRASDERLLNCNTHSITSDKPPDLRVVIFLHCFMQNTGHKGLNLFLKIALFYAFFCCFGAISGGFSTLVTTGVMIWTSANT